MALTKEWALDQAVKVAVAYGSGGSSRPPDNVIEASYKKIVQLMGGIGDEAPQGGKVNTSPREGIPIT